MMNFAAKIALSLGLGLLSVSVLSGPVQAQQKTPAECKAVYKQYPTRHCGKMDAACLDEKAKNRLARKAAGCPMKRED